MAFRHFPGWTETNLAAKLLELDEALMDGTHSGSSGDSSATHRTPEEIQKVRAQVLADLRVLNATDYGSSNPVRRTKVSFLN